MSSALRWLVVCLVVAAGAVIFAVVIQQRRDPLPLDALADYVLVNKDAHTLTLFQRGQTLRIYRVALGRGGSGQKQRAGDNKVPEGMYRISGRNRNSAFHQALRISYPSPEQVIEARQRGVAPGGDIMIHGIRNGLGWLGALQRYADWTKGCIAVTDPEIEEIWRVVPDGTIVEIRSNE